MYERNLPDKDLTVGPAAVDVVIPHNLANPWRAGNPDPADVGPAPSLSAPDGGVESDNCAMQSANAIVIVHRCAVVVAVVVLGDCDVDVSNHRGIILCDDNDNDDVVVVVVVIAGGSRRERREAERPQPAARADSTKRRRHAPPGGNLPPPPWRCSVAAWWRWCCGGSLARWWLWRRQHLGSSAAVAAVAQQ